MNMKNFSGLLICSFPEDILFLTKHHHEPWKNIDLLQIILKWSGRIRSLGNGRNEYTVGIVSDVNLR